MAVSGSRRIAEERRRAGTFRGVTLVSQAMDRRQLTWVIAVGVIAVLVAGMIDAVHSSRPLGSAPIETATTEESAARGTAIPVQTTAEALPRCTAQNIGVSIDVLGGTASVVMRHVWGRACHLASLRVRLSVTDRVGRRVRLATLEGGQNFQLAPGAISHPASSSSSTFPTSPSRSSRTATGQDRSRPS